MTEHEQGQILSFGMSAFRLRRIAQEYRRRGQPLEALSLIRRAAEQDDSALGWQALASELLRLGNWEAAQALLARVLSRDDGMVQSWLDMARCLLAMGEKQMAEDCLFHVVQMDPFSPEAQAGRELLRSQEEQYPQETDRVQRLSARAMRALWAGDTELALRRMKRALRLAKRKTPMLGAIALVYLEAGDERRALSLLTKAVCLEPGNPHALCKLAQTLHTAGRRRAARALLRKAIPLCLDARTHRCFTDAALEMNARRELAEHNASALETTPYRMALLHDAAEICLEAGDEEGAKERWRTILSIDPADRRAILMLAWTKDHPGQPLPRGYFPAPMVKMQTIILALKPEEMFTLGSDARRALDWCVASMDEAEQALALAMAEKHPAREEEIRWLREVLLRADVQEKVRQRALARLGTLGEVEGLCALVGGRCITTDFQLVKTPTARDLWRRFLRLLLLEAGGISPANELVTFAQACWKKMNMLEKQQAVADPRNLWGCILVSLYLWQQGKTLEAEMCYAVLGMPRRRLTRQLKRFGIIPKYS